MADKWTPQQLKKLQTVMAKKPRYITEYELAGRLSGQFKKSPESIRWQMRQFRRAPKEDFPKILVLDIETLPIEAEVFQTRKVYISPEQITKDWSVLSWSAKWLFGDKVYGQIVKPQDAVNRRDADILPDIWNMMNEAHAVISFNGNYFDLKRLNTRFLLAGMLKPMYSQSIDLYKVATDNFAFTKNSMDFINDALGIGRKVGTGFKWWHECAAGNQKYLAMMMDYNKHDVQVTEELYMKFRPWISSHLNMNIFSVDKKVDHCTVCSSANLEWSGSYTTPLGRYKAFRCQDCGALGRSTQKAYKLSGSRVRG